MHLNAGETPPARLLLKGKGEAAGTSGVYLESQLAKARSRSVANGHEYAEISFLGDEAACWALDGSDDAGIIVR